MHRSFTIILVLLLVVALAVPCFASSISADALKELGISYGIPAEAYDEMLYWTYFVYGSEGNEVLYVFGHTQPAYMEDNGLRFAPQEGYTLQLWYSDMTVKQEVSNEILRSSYFPSLISEVITNYDVKNEYGEVVYPSQVNGLICNGTTCPANDLNHDNICDDCGNVLVYNLRSTLLEYARSFASDNDSGYSYWAIFQIADQYRVYVSQTPIVSPNGVMIEGTDLKYALLYELDNGSFGYGSWYSGFDVNLTFIESNHTIENFTAPPLAAIIQGVTGEAMKVEIPNLHRTMKTLVLCGVGCLALLIGLKLFGKRSLLFLKK